MKLKESLSLLSYLCDYDHEGGFDGWIFPYNSIWSGFSWAYLCLSGALSLICSYTTPDEMNGCVLLINLFLHCVVVSFSKLLSHMQATPAVVWHQVAVWEAERVGCMNKKKKGKKWTFTYVEKHHLCWRLHEKEREKWGEWVCVSVRKREIVLDRQTKQGGSQTARQSWQDWSNRCICVCVS